MFWLLDQFFLDQKGVFSTAAESYLPHIFSCTNNERTKRLGYERFYYWYSQYKTNC